MATDNTILIGAKVHRPPNLYDLPIGMQRSLSELSIRLSKISCTGARVASNCFVAWLAEGRYPPSIRALEHYMSNRFIDAQIAERRPVQIVARAMALNKGRLLKEYQAFELCNLHLHLALGQSRQVSFANCLIKLISFIESRERDFRHCPVFLGGDSRSRRWAFPRADIVHTHIQELDEDVQRLIIQSPLLAAIALLANINCIHPFMDGNGRLSRVLFNGVLAHFGMLPPSAYIQIKVIYSLSKFGFELRLRELILRGDWLPLLTYFVAALNIHCDLALTNISDGRTNSDGYSFASM